MQYIQVGPWLTKISSVTLASLYELIPPSSFVVRREAALGLPVSRPGSSDPHSCTAGTQPTTVHLSGRSDEVYLVMGRFVGPGGRIPAVQTAALCVVMV